MLKLLYGAPGTGKTQVIFEEIRKLVASESKKVLVIVPEQFSFETERKLLSFLGERAFASVEVYSFTRLCHRLFELFGGNTRNYADSTAKILLMDLALREVSDLLEHYRKVSRSKSFVLSALQTVEELKVNGVTPEQYSEAVNLLPEDSSRKKLDEISLIFSTYQAFLERSYQDTHDNFSKALELVKEKRFFSDYELFIDEFKGFTKPEFDLIEEMMVQASSCTVTLCMNRDDENEPLFTSVRKTADRLKRLAQERCVPVAVPVNLAKNHRFQNDCLNHLGRNILRFDATPFDKKNTAVSAYQAVNEYDEADYALSWLREQVETKKYRYRDVVVMCRSLDDYQRVLEPAFQKYDIPYFIDSRFEIETFPPVRFITAALDAAVSRFDTEYILNALKCSMLPFSLEEISQLENYIYVWGISGSKWEMDFTANPRGFKGELTEEDREQLEAINHVRRGIITPLKNFYFQSREATVKEICQSLYEFLEKSGAVSVLSQTISKCHSKGEHDFAETYSRIWELLMKLLDTMVAAAGSIRMDLHRFAELFALAVRNSELADRPQALDCVMVGSPDRMRTDSPKALIVLGVNDGVFPFVPSEGSLLRDEERLALAELGLELKGNYKEKVLEERYIAYKTLTVPREQVLLTTRRADISGEAKQPSELLKQLSFLYTSAVFFDSEEVPPDFFCRSDETAFLTLASHYLDKIDFVKTTQSFLSNLPEYQEKLSLLQRAGEPQSFGLYSRDLSKRLFGERMFLSPSRIEAYYRCPFAYFCRYGLKALPRQKAELNPMERGMVIHDLLYRFVSECGDRMFEMTAEEIKETAGRYLERYISDVMGGDADKTKRFLASFYRLRAAVANIIARLVAEFRQSTFKPADFELEVGSSENVEPLVLKAKDGSEIIVNGTIDRVDLCEIDGQKYARVVDYKSGVKKFKLSDVYYGLNLQMILYLFTLWKNGKNKYEHVFPAGVLYMPAGEVLPELPRAASGDDAEKRRLAQYKMNGFVLEDPEVVAAMEPDARGVFIPVEQNKDGSFSKRSSLLKLEELGKLERYVTRLVTRMAEELYKGQIDATPSYSKGNRPPCEYCDYAAVCGRKRDGIKHPPVEDKTKEEFFAEVETGEIADAGR